MEVFLFEKIKKLINFINFYLTVDTKRQYELAIAVLAEPPLVNM